MSIESTAKALSKMDVGNDDDNVAVEATTQTELASADDGLI